MKPLLALLLLLLFFSITSLTHSLQAQHFDYPTAKSSTTWTNNPSSIPHSVTFTDGSIVRSILLRGSLGPRYAFGFYCKAHCYDSPSFLLSIFIVQTNNASSIITSQSLAFPQLVWSANAARPVAENATLALTRDGELILRDSDGSLVWSTATSTKNVTRVSLARTGNLSLLDRLGVVVWQSFDHPTDALLPGQALVEGQRLVDSLGEHSLSVTSDGLFAYIGSDPPQMYYAGLRYGSLDLPTASSAQYMKLDSDGHLRVYEWGVKGWAVVADVLGLSACAYPKVCGTYGICSNGHCSCPVGASGCYSFLRPVNFRRPDLGCSEVTPIDCKAPNYQRMIAFGDVSYFNYVDDRAAAMGGVGVEACKQACLKSCACRAALFRYGSDESSGFCYLLSKVYSMMDNEWEESNFNSTAFVKVQIPPPRVGH
ncbi:hypothetical protein QJS04_geneDACA020796 [Acorus gramineus]|uniref:Bulb-type lectin domain-containing protein n=1 Tax=Acorus gramineus TaxID=55184 RepID=A0AAV9BEC4_ACOGR|nr:hypothetical protein QJS04_geneDACA020796 [Acorus gramineus]